MKRDIDVQKVKKMVTDCIYLYFKLGHFLKACCVRLAVIWGCELT